MEPSWAGKHVKYGKDQYAYVPKSQQAAAQAAQAAVAQSLVAQTSLSPIQGQGNFGSPVTPYLSFTPQGPSRSFGSCMSGMAVKGLR